MKYQALAALCLGLFGTATLACSGPSAPPSAPSSSGILETSAAPDGSTLKATAPAAVSPRGGVEVDDDDPDLVITNASGLFVQNLPLSYVFEVFDEQNRLVYQSSPIAAGAGGRTSHEIGVPLPFDKPFTWRAYAVYQGARGPLSETATFRTYNRFGISCAHLRTELAIVQCRRAQYGFMSVPERVEFLRRIAYDLNRAPAEHAPYGILIKSTGHNCLGYSCDIICSNTGFHRQWDVLTDEDAAQIPVWSRLGQIAPRPCEVVQ